MMYRSPQWKYVGRLSGLFFIIFMTVALFVLSACPATAKPEGDSGNQGKKATKARVYDRKKAKNLAMEAAKAWQMGDSTKAINKFAEAVACDPTWDDGYIFQAQLYHKMKNAPNEAVAWKNLVRLHPDSDKYLINYAKALVDASDWEGAREAWDGIVKKDSVNVDAKYYLALCYFKLNNPVEAKKCCEDVLELSKEYYPVYVLLARMEAEAGSSFAARDLLQKVLDSLDHDDPVAMDAQDEMDKVMVNIRRTYIFIYVGIGLLIAAIGAAFWIYRYQTKVAFKQAPVELDAATEDAVCRYVLSHVTNITALPRGLCWTVSIDDRHLELQVSELIAEQSSLAFSPINKSDLDDWLESHGNAPFLYKTEVKDGAFQAAFAELIKDLQGVEINVGVPIVWQGHLLGLVLLGCSRNSKKLDMRRRFEERVGRIQDVAEKAAVALDRLRQKKLKDIASKTGLYNRDYFESKVIDVFRGCQTVGLPMSIYMMRMDQMPNILEVQKESYTLDIMHALGVSIHDALKDEPDITLCHLDNGVYALVAQERDSSMGTELAIKLKKAIDKARLPDRNLNPTGFVAWGNYPDDADNPKMLRAIVGRAFRDAGMQGNSIVRAEKVVDDAVVEKGIEEEIIVTRRMPGESSIAAPVPGSAVIPSPGLPIGQPVNPLAGPLPGIAALGVSPLPIAGGKAPVGPPISPLQLNFGSSSSSLLGKAQDSVSDNDGNYTLTPNLDENDVDIDTQFCSQETFEDLVNYEVNLANESGESCAVVYLRLFNKGPLRAKGKKAYIQLRRDLSALIRAFLREESDVPGLVGEDDFAVFLIGSSITEANSLADRITLTASNLNSQGLSVQLSIGIALRQNESVDGNALIKKASQAANAVGIHVFEVKK